MIITLIAGRKETNKIRNEDRVPQSLDEQNPYRRTHNHKGEELEDFTMRLQCFDTLNNQALLNFVSMGVCVAAPDPGLRIIPIIFTWSQLTISRYG